MSNAKEGTDALSCESFTGLPMENLFKRIVLICCLVTAAVTVIAEKSRRLLLDEPEVLASRLEQLEQKVVTLTAQVSQKMM